MNIAKRKLLSIIAVFIKYGHFDYERENTSQQTYLEASDDADGTPVLDADIEAILFLRSGKVSMTKSRNSNSAPTSFCSSYLTHRKRRKTKVELASTLNLWRKLFNHCGSFDGKMTTSFDYISMLCRERKCVRVT